MPTVLTSIATSNPPLRRSQEYAAAFMQRVTSIPGPIRKRIPAIYDRSAIDYRYSCIEDYAREASDFEFFPPTWDLEPAPSTSARNRKYREAVIPLAEESARKALDGSDVERSDVTHVVCVSCTGFFAPGLDIELVKRLGLRNDVQRTFIGFMGCYAAFNALRVAHGFCSADPDAVVLVVCAELCTLHFQTNDTLESAIVNALFSDGAAAAVLRSMSEEDAAGRLAYVEGRAELDDDSMEDMTWDIGDTGFLMGLTSRVPSVIAERLPNYLDALLAGPDAAPRGRDGDGSDRSGGQAERQGSARRIARDDVGFWAVHPGGIAVIEKAEEILDLPEGALHDSREVLRLHGNMSSPTILFILKRILDRGDVPATGVALAFGPGLTIEGALFRRV